MPAGSRKLPLDRAGDFPTPAVQVQEVVPTVAATGTPESKFVLKEFHRFEVRDGRKIWEAKGSQGQYFPEQNAARINDAKVWVYKKDGKDVSLTAGQALLKLQGPALIGAEASDGVVVQYAGEQTLETDRLLYDKDSAKITAPGIVQIRGALLDIEGESLEGDLNSNVFTLKRNVSTVLKPRVNSNANN